MITGRVTSNREAVISLEIAGPNRPFQRYGAAIDTGFNGVLTLPSREIQNLRLPYTGDLQAILGDGTVVHFDSYLATVRWHGYDRDVIVLESDTGPLAGMALLEGSRVTLDVTDGGAVLVEELP